MAADLKALQAPQPHSIPALNSLHFPMECAHCAFRPAQTNDDGGRRDDFLSRCDGCKETVYCSASCLQAAWELHRNFCKQFRGSSAARHAGGLQLKRVVQRVQRSLKCMDAAGLLPAVLHPTQLNRVTQLQKLVTNFVKGVATSPPLVFCGCCDAVSWEALRHEVFIREWVLSGMCANCQVAAFDDTQEQDDLHAQHGVDWAEDIEYAGVVGGGSDSDDSGEVAGEGGGGEAAEHLSVFCSPIDGGDELGDAIMARPRRSVPRGRKTVDIDEEAIVGELKIYDWKSEQFVRCPRPRCRVRARTTVWGVEGRGRRGTVCDWEPSEDMRRFVKLVCNEEMTLVISRRDAAAVANVEGEEGEEGSPPRDDDATPTSQATTTMGTPPRLSKSVVVGSVFEVTLTSLSQRPPRTVYVEVRELAAFLRRRLIELEPTDGVSAALTGLQKSKFAATIHKLGVGKQSRQAVRRMQGVPYFPRVVAAAGEAPEWESGASGGGARVRLDVPEGAAAAEAAEQERQEAEWRAKPTYVDEDKWVVANFMSSDEVRRLALLTRTPQLSWSFLHMDGQFLASFLEAVGELGEEAADSVWRPRAERMNDVFDVWGGAAQKNGEAGGQRKTVSSVVKNNPAWYRMLVAMMQGSM